MDAKIMHSSTQGSVGHDSNSFRVQHKVFWIILLIHLIIAANSVSDSLDDFLSLSSYKLPLHWLYFPYYANHILPDAIHLNLQVAIPYAMIPLVLVYNGNNRFIECIIRVSFLAFYFLYYSWSIYPSMFLTVPWDCMLLEIVVWSIFVFPKPNKHGYFILKWLLFRVVFGFGKLHFLGGLFEWNFVRSMFIWVPSPTQVGLYLFDLFPKSHLFWYLSHIFSFIAEIVAPIVIVYVTDIKKSIIGMLSLISVVFLMLGIVLTGNYGWFNSLTIWTCYGIYLFNDCNLISMAQKKYIGIKYIKKWLFYGYILLSLPFMLSNSFLTFHLWHVKPFCDIPIISPIINFAQNYRILHGYGIFPPLTFPPERWADSWQLYYYTDDDHHQQQLKHQSHYRIVTHMPDSASNSSMIPAPFELSLLTFNRFEYTQSVYLAAHLIGRPPSGAAHTGIAIWYLEAWARKLCKYKDGSQNDKLGTPDLVRRHAVVLGYSKGEFFHVVEPRMTHEWNCSQIDKIESSKQIIGVAEWDVRVSILEKLGEKENVFVWKENNLPYYELSQSQGMIECLNYIHLIPPQWHAPYCRNLHRLVIYLQHHRHLQFEQLEQWAQDMLGDRGKQWYQSDLITKIEPFLPYYGDLPENQYD